MVTKKDRRHSGYVTPQSAISKKDLEKFDIFINPFYDDWANYRDGFRDCFKDFKLIKRIGRRQHPYNHEIAEKRLRMNHKQKKLLKRRIAMKKKRNAICT